MDEMDSTPPVVSIIIVSYNVCEDLKACLDSVSSIRKIILIEVIVIDNASQDDSVQLVRQSFPWVTLVSNTHNMGFAAGVNQGLTLARAPYILLLNPDTVVYPDTIQRMYCFMENHPACGITGAQLLDADLSFQVSSGPFPTPIRFLAESFFLSRMFGAGRQHTEPYRVDTVVGACLMARHDMIRQIGPLDAQFFLYYEETDWCRRAHDRGWAIYTLPAAAAVHKHGRSSETRPGQAFVELYRSRALYMRRYFHPVSRWVTHAGMVFGVAFRVMLWGAMNMICRLTGRHDPHVANKWRQNRSVLAWYLTGAPPRFPPS